MTADDEVPGLYELCDRNAKIGAAMNALEEHLTAFVPRPAEQFDLLRHLAVEFKTDVIEAALGSYLTGASVDPGLFETHADLNDVLRRRVRSPRARTRLLDYVLSEFEPALIEAAMDVFDVYFPGLRNSEREDDQAEPST
jgi:hypothetical protein